MALRLSDLVVCGELRNIRKNSVSGRLALRGFERTMMIELTGNCAPDLVGRYIRFEPREEATRREAENEVRAKNGGAAEDDAGMDGRAESGDGAGRGAGTEPGDDPEVEVTDDVENERERLARLNLTGLAWQQIGVPGTMTAARRVKATDCPPDELYTRCKRDEPPPFAWKRCLYLEWFSQNGRVVIELVDPILELVEVDESAEDGERVTPFEPPFEDEPAEPGDGGPNITLFRLHEDGRTDIRDV
jgi:hypothetical protein